MSIIYFITHTKYSHSIKYVFNCGRKLRSAADLEHYWTFFFFLNAQNFCIILWPALKMYILSQNKCAGGCVQTE